MQETHTVDSPKKSRHVTDHLANERTFLAWIRTSIAVMTLGVAINRFALFLMEMHQIVPQVRDLANRHVEKLGIGLVMLGIVMLAVRPGTTFMSARRSTTRPIARPSRSWSARPSRSA